MPPTTYKDTPRPIVAKFVRYKDKERILGKAIKMLKSSGITVSEDYTRNVRDIRKKLIPFSKEARSSEKKSVHPIQQNRY